MVRAAGPEDASRLAEILVFAKRTAYRHIFCDDLVSFVEMQVLDLALHYRDEPAALDGVFVYDDGVIKGMLRGELCGDPDCGDTLELCELYVDPFFQASGVGGALMRHFLGLCENWGRLLLWVLKENASARRFYASFGFRQSGVEKAVAGTDVVEMQYVRAEQQP